MRARPLALRGDDERGFTLVELMIVVLILGILVSLALPTFVGARDRAANRAAQTDLRYTLTAARAIQVGVGDYTSANELPTGLVTMESSLCYVGGATVSVPLSATCDSGDGDASVSVRGSTSSFGAARTSATNVCFALVDKSGVIYFGKTGAAANCTADWALAPGNVVDLSPQASGW